LQTSSSTGTGNGNTDIRVAVSSNLQYRSRHLFYFISDISYSVDYSLLGK
jgi:hypothetical protein